MYKSKTNTMRLTVVSVCLLQSPGAESSVGLGLPVTLSRDKDAYLHYQRGKQHITSTEWYRLYQWYMEHS